VLTINFAAWHWPQWVIVCLWAVSLIGSAYLHGEQRTGTYSAVGTIISIMLAAVVLHAGGFFP